MNKPNRIDYGGGVIWSGRREPEPPRFVLYSKNEKIYIELTGRDTTFRHNINNLINMKFKGNGDITDYNYYGTYNIPLHDIDHTKRRVCIMGLPLQQMWDRYENVSNTLKQDLYTYFQMGSYLLPVYDLKFNKDKNLIFIDCVFPATADTFINEFNNMTIKDFYEYHQNSKNKYTSGSSSSVALGDLIINNKINANKKIKVAYAKKQPPVRECNKCLKNFICTECWCPELAYDPERGEKMY
jgi:hypothetical protein